MPGLWSDQASRSQDTKPSLWDPSAHGKAIVKDGNNFLSPGSRPTISRHSSATADIDDLSLGPSVVVPPKDMRRPTDAHETAAALELAKHRLSIGDGTRPTVTSSVDTTTDRYAFAFDIDGVLIRGGQPIPEAIEAMKVLNGQNEYGIKV